MPVRQALTRPPGVRRTPGAAVLGALLGTCILVSTAAGQAAAPAPAVPATQRPIGSAPTGTRAWTARVLLPTVGRAAPSSRARVTQRISPYAPYDNDPQVLLVLDTATGPGGPWYRVLLPVRPNGTSAWVRGSDLQIKATAYRVKVTLSIRRVEVLRAGTVVGTYTAGVGTPANPTPTGLFAISERVPQANPNGFFGPYIVTLAAHSLRLSDFDGGKGQVAMHGTNLPQLLGGAVSHGCVRLDNDAITSIATLVPPGAPVQILP